MRRPVVSFKWYDFWVGAFYNYATRTLYVCPLPMLCFEIRLGAALEGKPREDTKP